MTIYGALYRLRTAASWGLILAVAASILGYGEQTQMAASIGAAATGFFLGGEH